MSHKRNRLYSYLCCDVAIVDTKGVISVHMSLKPPRLSPFIHFHIHTKTKGESLGTSLYLHGHDGSAIFETILTESFRLCHLSEHP